MLEIRNLDYRVEARPLFEAASARIAAGWKVGLIGRNGTGKSTLLRLIREEITSPSKDSPIRLQNGARLGWVAQEVAPSDQTILEVVLEADTERHALMQEAEHSTDPDRIGDIHARLLDIDAWSAEARAAEVLMGLGFRQADLERPTREFSGGWRMRAAIAGALFAQPDLLLLDEPSNYLDLEGAAWLERYLQRYPHTVLIVSHDRELLNRSVTHTMALEHRKLAVTPGGYDDWLRLRAAKLAQLESQRTKQAAERAHLQAFVDRFRAKASKARQAQSRVKMLEKMQDVSIPIAERTTPFSFPAPDSKLSPPLLEIKGAELGYGAGARILSKVEIRLDPDDRIAIVGTNGQGKTTLVKSIAGRLALMGGERLAPKSIRIGYFSQDQLDELTAGDTLLTHVMRALPADTPVAKQRSVAAQMGFSHEKVDTLVEKLSGGEKVRLILGLIAMTRPHILILDEPTSHLDIDSREALIFAINDFPGAVLLITHDVYLAEATAGALWLVKDGRVAPYDGDLDDYRTLIMSADREKPAAAAAPAPKASASREPAAPLKRQADAAEKAYDRLMADIRAIDAELAAAGLAAAKIKELSVRRSKLEADARQAEAKWLEALELYEAAQG
jgi:ATP-binding cassette, subfamily F, member 3